MRLLALFIVALLLAIQWPLWLGPGGWRRVGDLERQVQAQREANATQRATNEALLAEVNSLREGREAVEERARYEMRLIRGDETFFQWLQAPGDAGKQTPQSEIGATPKSTTPSSPGKAATGKTD